MGRIKKGPSPALEDATGMAADLITLKTGKPNKNETAKKIKTNLENWMENVGFDELRGKLLDIAIVAKVNKQRMEAQDLDNIAKIVLDSLKKNDKLDFKRDTFLFKDDSQVVRLLVYKMPREEDELYSTDELVISFREHDSKKQMILVEKE
jgi:Holliday junction resolvase RusA-like endonuclease